jgi:O-antigen/teichoic acid export membrane protein
MTTTEEAAPAVRAGARTRVSGMLAGLIDSGLSSIGNLGVSAVAASRMELREFGVFSTCLLAALVGVGLLRSSHGEPLMLTYSSRSVAQRRAGFSAVLTSSLVAACAAALLVAAAATLATPQLRTPLLCLAVCLPALALQDTYRWAAHTAGLPFVAARGSSAWTAGILITLAAMVASGRPFGPGAYLLVWGATAGLGALVVATSLRLRPGLSRPRRWAEEHGAVGSRFVVDFLLLQSTAEGAFLLVAALAGSDDIGLLRMAQLPLGPIVVLTAGMSAYLQPALARELATAGPSAVRKLAWATGGATAGIACAAAAAVWMAPAGVVELLMGEGWREARHLVPVLGAYLAAGCLGAALGVAVRTLGGISQQLRIRFVLAPLSLLLVAAAAVVTGATGSAVALAVSTAVVTGAWAVLLSRRPTADAQVGHGASR